MLEACVILRGSLENGSYVEQLQVVEAGIPAERVLETLREGAGDLLEDMSLFDVYAGKGIDEGHKSLAFALRFRAPDRTLTADEASESRAAAVALAAERFGAVQP